MSTTEINAYLEWRAEREGKTVDVSPEAWALENATGAAIDRADDLANSVHSIADPDDPLVVILRETLAHYWECTANLNGDN